VTSVGIDPAHVAYTICGCSASIFTAISDGAIPHLCRFTLSGCAKGKKSDAPHPANGKDSTQAGELYGALVQAAGVACLFPFSFMTLSLWQLLPHGPFGCWDSWSLGGTVGSRREGADE